MPTSQGAIHLFRFRGIDVFLHWSWFVVALFEISERTRQYRSPAWNVAEYLALFAIVTLHEFGHSSSGSWACSGSWPLPSGSETRGSGSWPCSSP